MFYSTRPILAAVAVGSVGLFAAHSGIANAASMNSQSSSAKMQRLQNQINNLQSEMQQLRHQQHQQKQKMQVAEQQAQKKSSGPKKKLSLSGGVIAEYQALKGNGEGHTNSGQLNLDYFEIGVNGAYGNWTYKAQERLGGATIAGNNRYLHYAQASYHFGPNKDQKVTGGMFQVPFGNLPYGYQSFWGNLTYYMGFTDNQAAGLGYTYQKNGWRLDIDAFKNQALNQSNTYGGTLGKNYKQINGGNARLAYTYSMPRGDTLNVNVGVQGGQVQNKAASSQPKGTRYAATVAGDAEFKHVGIGKLTLQGQVVEYKYNIPDGRNSVLGTGKMIRFRNYGFAEGPVPSKGQIYSANIEYGVPIHNFGPLNKIAVFDNYQYLHSGYGTVNSDGYHVGNIQANQAGIEAVAGPVYAWAGYISGKNDAASFNGHKFGNDGNWHNRFNLAIGYYFSGTVVNSGS